MNTDVAIIGAGPAGCAAALNLAQLGCSVTLVGRPRARGEDLGEMLAPRGRALLRQSGFMLDMQTSHARVPGIISAWGGAEPQWHDFLLNPFGEGWLLDRPRFDEALSGECADAGVTVVPGRALATRRRPDRGWQIDLEERVSPLLARILVDATGRAATVLGRHAERVHVLDRLVGIAFVGPRSASCSHEWTVIEAVPHGWFYSARLSRERSVAMFMTDGDLIGSRDALPCVVQRAIADAPITRARVGAIVADAKPFTIAAMTVRRTHVCHADWLLCGDSAASYDPLSGQGICHALESGLHAGRAIHGALEGDADALARYRTWMHARFDEYLGQRHRYYAIEQRWPDAPFWQRRHALH